MVVKISLELFPSWYRNVWQSVDICIGLVVSGSDNIASRTFAFDDVGAGVEL
jgi:hypothetical protein